MTLCRCRQRHLAARAALAFVYSGTLHSRPACRVQLSSSPPTPLAAVHVDRRSLSAVSSLSSARSPSAVGRCLLTCEEEEAPDWLANSPKGIRARSNCAEFYNVFRAGNTVLTPLSTPRDDVRFCICPQVFFDCRLDFAVSFALTKGGRRRRPPRKRRWSSARRTCGDSRAPRTARWIARPSGFLAGRNLLGGRARDFRKPLRLITQIL